MNKKVLNTLEYDKIVEQLAKLAGSDGGKKLCRSLTPMTDRDEILEAQCETSAGLPTGAYRRLWNTVPFHSTVTHCLPAYLYTICVYQP